MVQALFADLTVSLTEPGSTRIGDLHPASQAERTRVGAEDSPNLELLSTQIDSVVSSDAFDYFAYKNSNAELKQHGLRRSLLAVLTFGWRDSLQRLPRFATLALGLQPLGQRRQNMIVLTTEKWNALLHYYATEKEN